ncbi:Deuterolysin metalloprotease family-domain-containing protein [Xylariaceae sp. FL0016]|nr:Deuterolysin metalloprotease family-domain-containing protein [Xylariaceae sp. FL0016]
MRCASSLYALAGFATVVSAHVPRTLNGSRSPSLRVTLARVVNGGPAELAATIENVGSVDLNLLKVGTLLDDTLPVQKVSVVDENGDEVSFKGIHATLKHDVLRPEHFQVLKVAESVSTSIDAASVHEFPSSGTYSFKSTGVFSVAGVNSTVLGGPPLLFESNTLNLHVDAQAAARKSQAISSRSLQDRTNIQDGCNATQLAASTQALSDCQTIALAAAADAADPASARFVEYFGTNASATRQTVADRLTAVADECAASPAGGASRYFCYDYYGVCESSGPLIAYTLWDVDTVVMCPLFYDSLPALPVACHQQDRATTSIHEMTHCEEVYSPHTNDYAYAYNESVALPPETALLNADNYSLFANAVYMKC